MRSTIAGLAFVAVLAAPASAQILFPPPVASAADGYLLRVQVGDVNGDGLPDAVTSRLKIFLGFGPPALYLNEGGGLFGAAGLLPGTAVFRMADFNRDGHLDLLVAHGGPANEQAVSVHLGDGRGGFGPAIGISDGSSAQDPDDAAVGDFDGDGALDVVVHRGVEPFLLGRIMVVFGHGDGSFDPPLIVVPFVGMDTLHNGRIEVGDLNGDGLDDFVYTTGHSSPVMLSQGDRSFAFAPCTEAGCGLTTDRDFELVDVDGDGRADAVTNQRVFLAQPDGSLAAGQVFPSAGVPFAVGVGDLDGDGHADVALGLNQITTEVDLLATVGDLLVLRGHGDGSFDTDGVVLSHVPQPRWLSVTDVDADGRPDVVVAELQQFVAVRTALNRTYAPGSPFLDVGHALAGTNGYPIQLAEGTLVASQPFAFTVANGPANGAAFHIVGLSAIDAPFKGGTLVPSLTLINGPFGLDAAGDRTLAGHWPAGGSGLTLWAQFWMPDAGGPAGLVASSGVRAQIP